MLKQRLITALVLVVLVVWGVLTFSPAVFTLITGVVVLFGAWEWSRLLPLPAVPLQLGFVMVALALLYAIDQSHAREIWLLPILLASLAVWALILLWLRFPGLGRGRILLKGLVAIPVLVPPWLAVTSLHALPQTGSYWVLYLLLLIWLADSGAYFTGRALGRHKLAPAVSPGKTWEGVAGGLAASAMLALITGLALQWPAAQLGQLIALTVLTALLSVVGDLLISLLKRQVGVKDSGRLVPGHGGILDRIDSLLAGAPVFVLGAYRLGLVQ